MNALLILLLLAQAPVPPTSPAGEKKTDVVIKQIVDSGRVLTLVRPLDEKVRIAPGVPPLLAFRYLEGRQRGRFGGLDLVLDDAGH
jgi:hypothetical protein